MSESHYRGMRMESILVADGDATIRDVIVAVLRNEGHTVAEYDPSARPIAIWKA